MNGRLPDFVVIGAGRSGTTSLHNYLDGHPGVFMAPKEPNFFTDEHQRGLAWYQDLFASAGPTQLAGEASPKYMYDPAALDRMATTVPAARLIALLRNPVDRAYSNYAMRWSRGRDRRSFEQAVADERAGRSASHAPYLDRSRYIVHLRAVAERFPAEQLLVELFEDLVARPDETFARVCRFIGADDSVQPAMLGQVVNSHVGFRSLTVDRAVRSRLGRNLPRALQPVRRVVRRANARPTAAYPPLDPSTRADLTAWFAPDNAELASWLGRDLGVWDGAPQPVQPRSDPTSS